MNNSEEILAAFLAKNTEVQPELKEGEILVQGRDGLFERHELVNPKLVTQDGRQLLREQTFEK